jgi:DNA-binding response OmpR family regulator
LSDKILLVTTIDETFQQPLLQSQGYDVQKASLADALQRVENDNFELALVTTETGLPETVAFCQELKRLRPEVRVGVIAQRAEYVGPDGAIDGVIRMQHSPAKFLATVKKLLSRSSDSNFRDDRNNSDDSQSMPVGGDEGY